MQSVKGKVQNCGMAAPWSFNRFLDKLGMTMLDTRYLVEVDRGWRFVFVLTGDKRGDVITSQRERNFF